MKRRLVLAALTLLTSFWGEARAVTLDEIAAVAAKTPSFAADFKMVKKTPSVPVPLTSTGRVTVVENTGLLWHTVTPFEDVIGFSKTKSGALNEKGAWQEKALPGAERFYAVAAQLMAGDFSLLKDRFFVTVTGTKTKWTMIASPKDTTVSQWVTEVLTEGAASVTRVQFALTSGTITDIRFGAPQVPPALSAADKARLESLK